jgi:hypothetical protein
VECIGSVFLVAKDPSTDFGVADTIGGKVYCTAASLYSLPAQFPTTSSQLLQSCWTATVRGNGSNLHPASRLAGWDSVVAASLEYSVSISEPVEARSRVPRSGVSNLLAGGGRTEGNVPKV